MSRDDAIGRVMGVFRDHGYDGASLTRLQAATGLRSSSLYNYFPNGKRDMAAAALAHAEYLLAETVICHLNGPGSLADRLRRFSTAIARFYEDGAASCLLDVLAVGEARGLFTAELASATRGLLGALTALAEEAGATPEQAFARAEEALAAIEGALVLSRALGDTGPFERALDRLPRLLLAPTLLDGALPDAAATSSCDCHDKGKTR